MKKWTDFHDIKLKLEKKWKSGEILRGFNVEGFPFNLKINGNKVEEQLELPVDEDSLTKTFMN